MRGYLLDTNCISELVRVTPDPRVVAWMEATDEELLYLSVLTLGEIRKGLTGLAQGRRRTGLEIWLAELQARFSDRILPIDAPVAERWGVLAAFAKGRGVSPPVMDGLLAATALHHDLTVVSRNAGDFRFAQVWVLNPWTA